MRDLINVTSPAVRTQLTEGAFYPRLRHHRRGHRRPTGAAAHDQRGYPFSDANVFEGFIYYTRLSQGSANGLAMVALETVPPATQRLFCGGSTGANDNREEIDPTGRASARSRLSTRRHTAPRGIDGALAASTCGSSARPRSTAAPGPWSSPGVPVRTGGPSIFCDVPANSCSPNYIFRQYDQDGNLLLNTTIRLDHVVNVIENSSLTGTQRGWISIFDIPNVQIDLQVYAFSFNSANPAGNPNLTWDAIFEGYIVTDDAI